ncbi:MAG: hypothetical protein N7Q72_06500 [Spiroplasma sp. Tabriz.8]|nr:hypothetical protein [Spiroplasma sp. Tabriz.8]
MIVRSFFTSCVGERERERERERGRGGQEQAIQSCTKRVGLSQTLFAWIARIDKA